MPTFKASHTNSDENLIGWNSRYIYVFSAPDSIEVPSGSEVFSTISTSLKKGTNFLPQNYFNCDDGRTFKISMYFLSELNGSNFMLNTGILDESSNEYTISTKGGTLHKQSNISEWKLFKYETILTKWYDASAGNTKLNINGNIIYSGSSNSSNDDINVKFIQIDGSVSFNASITPNLIIKNVSENKIKVKNITIEEIK